MIGLFYRCVVIYMFISFVKNENSIRDPLLFEKLTELTKDLKKNSIRDPLLFEQLTKLTKDLKNAKEEKSKLEKQLDSAQRNYSDIIIKVTDVYKNFLNSLHYLSGYKMKVKDAETKMESIDNKISDLNKKIYQLNEQSQTYEERFQFRKPEIEKLIKECYEKDKKLKDLLKTNGTNNKEISKQFYENKNTIIDLKLEETAHKKYTANLKTERKKLFDLKEELKSFIIKTSGLKETSAELSDKSPDNTITSLQNIIQNVKNYFSGEIQHLSNIQQHALAVENVANDILANASDTQWYLSEYLFQSYDLIYPLASLDPFTLNGNTYCIERTAYCKKMPEAIDNITAFMNQKPKFESNISAEIRKFTYYLSSSGYA